MAVYTEVTPAQAAALLRPLGVGELIELRGCPGGIENTNYFASVRAPSGERKEYVLTLFERLSFEQLPFYLYLMQHLAAKGIPVPNPAPDASGTILHRLHGKPAALVNKLRGHSELSPQPAHCAQLGTLLARMHLAALDYPRQQPNLRGLAWWNQTAPEVLPHLSPAQAALLRSELALQNELAQQPRYHSLPRGPVHADLFRDNVMFEGGELTGVFDFYFAGCDTWLFDLGVCLNDWCIDLASGQPDAARSQALLEAYQRLRPFTPAEHALLPALRRAAALRFWLSRLWDWYLPRAAALLQPHDPTHFERVLRARVEQA